MINIYNKKTKTFGKINHIIKNDESIIAIDNDLFNECVSLKSKGYDVELDDNLNIIKSLNETKLIRIKERKFKDLREYRKILLEAFDKYKSNINYGIAIEDEETRAIIVSWYSDLLNLVESAFEEDNIPSEIKYYL